MNDSASPEASAGYSAAREARRHPDADAAGSENFQARLRDVRVHFVAHAAGEEQYFDSAFSGGGIVVAELLARGFGRELRKPPVADQRGEQRRAHRFGGVVLFAHDEPPERRGNLGEERKQLRVAEHGAEYQLFHGREPEVFCGDFTRLQKRAENVHARRACRLAGAAQQAPVEPLPHALGVRSYFSRQVGEQRQLAARHVGFPHGFREHRTHRLACPALHARREPVVELCGFLREFCEPVHVSKPPLSTG